MINDEKFIRIEARVDFTPLLQDAFMQHLRDAKAGSVREDKEWYDQQINRAEAGEPDEDELRDFILMSGGYFMEASGGAFMSWHPPVE